MARNFGLPNTMGRELSSLTSFKSISDALTQARNLSIRMVQNATNIGTIAASGANQKRNEGYSSFLSSVNAFKGKIGGSEGKVIDSLIEASKSRIESAGGANISGKELHSILGELKEGLKSAGEKLGGDEGAHLSRMIKGLEGAQGDTRYSGFKGMAGGEKDMIKAAYGMSSFNMVKEAIANVSSAFKETASQIKDPNLKTAIDKIKEAMDDASNAASTSADKLKALGNAKKDIENLIKTSSGMDKGALQALQMNIQRLDSEMKKANSGRMMQKFGQTISKPFVNAIKTFGTTLNVVGSLKRTFDVANGLFQTLNGKINQFARMQMGITAERAGYGRTIRGAGIRFGDMMGAISAGRTAGMEDRTVIGQMANLQTEMARARWGEGSMIEAAGRWGISTYHTNGDVKTANEMMIEFSRKLRSLGSDMEKLQFLTHMNFRPDQMEYVANYEKEAKRMEMVRANPHLQTVLDRADILDEDGTSARIDKYTKIEQRRRQIENQNAIDKGLWSGIKRSLNPENWLFNDWTARQKGVRSANAEIANEKMTGILNDILQATKENGGDRRAAIEAAFNAPNVTAENLTGLIDSLKLAAEQKGDPSIVKDFEEAFRKTTGITLDTRTNVEKLCEKLNDTFGKIVDWAQAAVNKLMVFLNMDPKEKGKKIGKAGIAGGATLAGTYATGAAVNVAGKAIGKKIVGNSSGIVRNAAGGAVGGVVSGTGKLIKKASGPLAALAALYEFFSGNDNESTDELEQFAEGGKSSKKAVFGEKGTEYAIPVKHTKRTANLIDNAAQESGFGRPISETTKTKNTNAILDKDFISRVSEKYKGLKHGESVQVYDGGPAARMRAKWKEEDKEFKKTPTLEKGSVNKISREEYYKRLEERAEKRRSRLDGGIGKQEDVIGWGDIVNFGNKDIRKVWGNALEDMASEFNSGFISGASWGILDRNSVKKTITDDESLERQKQFAEEHPIAHAIKKGFGTVAEIAGGLLTGGVASKALKATGAGKFLSPVGGWVADKAKAIGGFVGNKAKPVGGWIADKSKSFGGWLADKAKPLGEWVGDKVRPVGGWLSDKINPFGGWIADKSKSFGGLLADKAKKVGGYLWNHKKEASEAAGIGLYAGATVKKELGKTKRREEREKQWEEARSNSTSDKNNDKKNDKKSTKHKDLSDDAFLNEIRKMIQEEAPDDAVSNAFKERGFDNVNLDLFKKDQFLQGGTKGNEYGKNLLGGMWLAQENADASLKAGKAVNVQEQLNNLTDKYAMAWKDSGGAFDDREQRIAIAARQSGVKDATTQKEMEHYFKDGDKYGQKNIDLLAKIYTELAKKDENKGKSKAELQKMAETERRKRFLHGLTPEDIKNIFKYREDGTVSTDEKEISARANAAYEKEGLKLETNQKLLSEQNEAFKEYSRNNQGLSFAANVQGFAAENNMTFDQAAKAALHSLKPEDMSEEQRQLWNKTDEGRKQKAKTSAEQIKKARESEWRDRADNASEEEIRGAFRGPKDEGLAEYYMNIHKKIKNGEEVSEGAKKKHDALQLRIGHSLSTEYKPTEYGRPQSTRSKDDANSIRFRKAANEVRQKNGLPPIPNKEEEKGNTTENISSSRSRVWRRYRNEEPPRTFSNTSSKARNAEESAAAGNKFMSSAGGTQPAKQSTNGGGVSVSSPVTVHIVVQGNLDNNAAKQIEQQLSKIVSDKISDSVVSVAARPGIR